MKQYLCYYCDVKSDTFQSIIDHLTSCHIHDCIKYRELELNEVTGTAAYRNKAHVNIVTADGDIVVTADSNHCILQGNTLDYHTFKYTFSTSLPLHKVAFMITPIILLSHIPNLPCECPSECSFAQIRISR